MMTVFLETSESVTMTVKEIKFILRQGDSNSFQVVEKVTRIVILIENCVT